MSFRIGVLLPRSTDYPAIGFDILDGLRSYFKQAGKNDVQFISENIGFGDDPALSYSKAEKLILQDDVHVIVAYSNPNNAEPFYTLATATQRLFILLDPGVQHPQEMKHPYIFHISLQLMEASYLSGTAAAKQGKKVLMATSFYEGGYRAPWAATKAIEENQGVVCGNYVTPFRVSEFNIDQYLSLMELKKPDVVCASFSIYLADLFMKALKNEGDKATALPFYCNAFMAEEQELHKWEFPGGTFHAFIPWASAISNPAQQVFVETIKKEKNKAANIFHLIGWEAGIVCDHLSEKESIPADALKSWSFESPRGKQIFHPDTHYTYGPLYQASIVQGENGKCTLALQQQIPADAELQASLLKERPESSSDWKNNYLCI
ncbi:MAG: transporter substrate-binding protein [Bacteroidetes bacterium]|nr:transporter substrate-binding protein [Bacteroidota bacterium]